MVVFSSSMRIDTQKIEPAPETRAQTARETETPEKAKAVAEKASDSPGLQRAQTARDSPSKRPTSMTEDERMSLPLFHVPRLLPVFSCLEPSSSVLSILASCLLFHPSFLLLVST